MAKSIRAFGTWNSPISPRSLAESLRLNDVQWDGDTLVWHEGRGARGVIVAQQGVQAPRDLTGDLSARAGVGYGGGDFTADGAYVYFAGPGGRLYKQPLSAGAALPLTPAFGDVAAPRLSPDGRWLLYVHSYERSDSLALVDTEGKIWPRRFASGTDFVMQPAWHPAGEYVAYIAWDHPNMPWDGTELRLGVLEYDRAGVPYAAETETLAGDAHTAIFQPEFSPDGRWLSYISDTTGWNQLYLYNIAHQTHHQLTTAEADHGAPAWIQGLRLYGWTPDSRSIVYVVNQQGFSSLWQSDVATGNTARIPGLDHYADIDQVAVSASGSIAFIASGPKISPRIVSIQPDEADVPSILSLSSSPPSIQVIVGTEAGEQIHRRAGSENVPSDELAEAQAITWKGHDGEDAHGLYYAPASTRYDGTGAPPLIVHVHGGPTSQVTAGYSAVAQFFATRGYAVLFPNHRGSTGYGKAYMNKLRGNWGLYDVEDSASGAAHLAAQGLADARKVVIMGGSAGGFTVLQSLVDKPGFYKAGVCLFGVSNQFTLVADTHKFEERYSDSLLGTLPEAADNYRLRSPIFHAQKIVDPLIVFQGEDDKVVPKAQSEAIVASLRARNIPHEYHLYAGEGHGWRKPETIEHYYNAVTSFLRQYVIFA